ncbi:glycoside hydrolase superfamily [Mycena galopus ATCC 62051]|nr:glycoside hydrolase superfamily [Mycena galopus ATCC 62051]
MIHLVLFSLFSRAAAGGNGPALTPQMGWNTWNSFSCNIDEDLILSSAQAIKDKNLTSFGYECKYVVIDDCWQAASRDNTTGAPVEDPVRFPNGLKHVADQIHSLGLKASLPGFIVIFQSNERRHRPVSTAMQERSLAKVTLGP